MLDFNNVSPIKPIETRYRGYRFRSRLEARWAVFFDRMGVPYQYEPEGFDLDGTWYLPDFYLPMQNAWVEIKPKIKGIEPARQLLAKLVGEDGPGFLVAGSPSIFFSEWLVFTAHEMPIGEFDGAELYSPVAGWWCQAEKPGVLGIHINRIVPEEKLLKALEEAQSARFEHEERGR